MPRRVFLSYQHRDHGRAKGFDLMGRSPHVEIASSVRHLLNPVASQDPEYVGRKIREQQKFTSVTVVLVGKDTHKSDWVAKEIDWSLSKDPPNGLLAIRIDPDASLPQGLVDYSAEVLDWTRPSTIETFEAAIERAALRAGRGPAIAASATAANPSSCNR
jgi:hypothetical protein